MAESISVLEEKLTLLEKENSHIKEMYELIKAENQRLKSNDDQGSTTSSTSTTSNLRRIGESGKSTKELEKTIVLMKKIILRLQNENDALKTGNTK